MSDFVFGPVPSRRLGKSIGINNIPPKICSYACIYCQLGRAVKMEAQRRRHYEPQEVIEAVKKQVKVAEERNEKIDYLTFVPDGEATLDANLVEIIDGLKDMPYKLAIITNSSLIDREDVRNELMKLDLVSVKVDAFHEDVWRKIDHPHRSLDFDSIKKGLEIFAAQYTGKLITETMLIDGVNDETHEMEQIAAFISTLLPHTAYISIPTRSPARKDVKPASEEKINEAFQIFSNRMKKVEYLIGHEGNAFAHTGDTEKDILGITAVHPMRDDSLEEFLRKDGKDWSLVRNLLNRGLLLETNYGGHNFYVRKISERQQIE